MPATTAARTVTRMPTGLAFITVFQRTCAAAAALVAVVSLPSIAVCMAVATVCALMRTASIAVRSALWFSSAFLMFIAAFDMAMRDIMLFCMSASFFSDTPSADAAP